MADLIKFSTESTNIFPAANSTLGGQLVSEWNLRTRESVPTPSKIKYMVGPSFVHSMDDYNISLGENSSSLRIAEGRGIFNGHFVESLSPIIVDMLEENAKLVDSGKAELSGDLTVGVRVFYSNTTAMDAIKVENDNLMYEGIKIVVLPSSSVKTPIDTPSDSTKVNMHLKLGTFTFFNGAISSIVPNPNKIEAIEAERIANIDNIADKYFVKKNDLDPAKLYVYNTKLSDGKQLDRWCAADDSLIIWDNDTVTSRIDGLTTEMYRQYQAELGGVPEAEFNTTTSGHTVLVAPHKQVDDAEAVPDRLIFLPKADFVKNTAGTVSPEYTKNVKEIEGKINALLNLGGSGSKCRAFIEVLDGSNNSRSNLKTNNRFPSDEDVAGFNVGDYIIVASDYTAVGDTNATYTASDGTEYTLDQIVAEATLPPSTMYIVIPGIVTAYGNPTRVPSTGSYTEDNIPDKPSGFNDAILVQLGTVADPAISTITRQYIQDNFVMPDESGIRGAVGKAYIKITQTIYGNDGVTVVGYADWYAKVTEAKDNVLTETPVLLTGKTSLATEFTVGGFLDIPSGDDNYRNKGYVQLNGEGRLQVVDFDYLASGVLAYQLKEDQISGKNDNTETLQSWLDDYVNERVAFPKSDSDVINVDIYITQTESESQTITIKNIDSRFGASVYLHIHTSGNTQLTDSTKIYIEGCEKIRIDNNIVGNPEIHLLNSNLFYDADVLNRLTSIQGLGLWYDKRYGDLDVQIDGMTVCLTDPPSVPETFSFWDNTTPNDNHYQYGLRSITFGTNGDIIGCSIVICDRMTANISNNDSLTVYARQIDLPQSMGFVYPETRVTKPLKVTGSFVTAYPQSDGYIIKETEFSFLIKPYGSGNTTNAPTYASGMISLLTRANKVTKVVGVDIGTEICSWKSDKYHVFSGGLI